MSLHKAIISGKEKRKRYTKAKMYSRSCRNHGGCPYCESNRFYNDKKNRTAADQELDHFLDPNSGIKDEEYEQFYDDYEEPFEDPNINKEFIEC